jgi:hypothetical protein
MYTFSEVESCVRSLFWDLYPEVDIITYKDYEFNVKYPSQKTYLKFQKVANNLSIQTCMSAYDNRILIHMPLSDVTQDYLTKILDRWKYFLLSMDDVYSGGDDSSYPYNFIQELKWFAEKEEHDDILYVTYYTDSRIDVLFGDRTITIEDVQTAMGVSVDGLPVVLLTSLLYYPSLQKIFDCLFPIREIRKLKLSHLID